MKRLVVLLCAALGACSLTGGKRGGDVAPAVYDLGVPPSRLATAPAVPPLAVEVRAPVWHDSPAIQYRLAYADPARLYDYSRARWAGPPASLVQQRLVQQLGLAPAGQGGAKCLVRIDLDEFSQVFAAPQSSRGVLHARLAVLDHSRRPLADTAWRIERPVPTPDSPGGAAALAAAADQLGRDLGAWAGELAAQGRLKPCGN